MVENQFNNNFIPTSIKEIQKLGWDYIDVILITGDAYIDHPSFGISVIARILENAGFKVAVLPQPNWRDDLRDFKKLGRPRLFFGISGGNLDSMVNHYTAGKRLRSDDAYSVGGRAGFRPDYATVVYSNIIKNLFPETPIILGGIEASMRRFAHYDYWKNEVLTSILASSKADFLVYGMGEKTILEIAKKINSDTHSFNCFNINQIAYLSDFKNNKKDDIILHGFKEIKNDKIKYAENFVKIEQFSNSCVTKRIVQDLEIAKLIVNPPLPTISEQELDEIYALPFTRKPHPRYVNKEVIPAYEMIKDSVTIHRGCFGGCSFCTISAHQGKHIVSRSEKSILEELNFISKMPEFKGHISDLGGPSANMYKMIGTNQDLCKSCSKASCVFPNICKNLNTSHSKLYELYEKSLKIKNIKKISIGSGIRYDLILNNNSSENNKINRKYLELLLTKFVSGRLKVAPEHCSDKVLKLIRKPKFQTFKDFNKIFNEINEKFNLKQQLIPYFISGHPGCEETDMAELAIFTKNLGFRLEQVQMFTPTPMTLSTTMYYTGINPYTKEKIFSAKSKEQQQSQLQYFFWYKDEYKKNIIKILTQQKRQDLIEKLFSKKS
ncbi:MAG: YgiQ family radical SAM protein [Bacteroidales bacterium]|nr:YgiQ family radical SAM protein [Bacteroidales bacterium]